MTLPLIQALKAYDQRQCLRLHMPGHAGHPVIESLLQQSIPGITPATYIFDQTEVEGLDVLGNPTECLQESQSMAAGVFGCAHSFYLTQGATTGLQAAMLCLFQPGDKVLLPRNVHRAILSGLIISGVEPIWFLPEALGDWGLWGAVQPATLETLMTQHPEAKGLILSSPTYEGLSSPVREISRVCHRHGLKLIVDEAHGSLWPFAGFLPTSACLVSADVVIHSLHKTAGSLTQTAIAHIPFGSCLEKKRVQFQEALNTLHTTSPSYLLLAHIEATVAALGSTTKIQEKLQSLHQTMLRIRGELSQKTELSVLGGTQPEEIGQDPFKLFLQHPRINGDDWGVVLEATDGLAYEACTPYGVLYQAGLGTSEELLNQMLVRLIAAHKTFNQKPTQQKPHFWENSACLPVLAMSPREAFFAPSVSIPKEQALDHIAKHTIVSCPPGIPVLMPGERIQPHHLPQMPDTVWVICE
ncbi:MAG: aminotransferase class I/II-fold pyridoxal phosphate-dependent enzyme [Cyanobacteria bacterium]|nr:aminotransferase class I/II-fold pyridoxal phosphate-dependent enzyme [Cyanobacteriota bacterium]